MRECDCSETCTNVLMLYRLIFVWRLIEIVGCGGQNLLLNWGKPEGV